MSQLSKKDQKKLRKLQRKAGVSPLPKRAPRRRNPNRNRTQKAPVALGNRTGSKAPSFSTLRNGGVRIRHMEYLAEMNSHTENFAVDQTFPLNPGMRATFPWLYRIALRYESYKFHKLAFHYKTESPTSMLGYVALIPDFDPSDPAPTSKTQAMNYEGTAKVAPWENVTMSVPKHNLEKHKTWFVRSDDIPTTSSLGLFDVGNLFVCCGGNGVATANLGEVWISYDVEFSTPQMQEPDPNDVRSATILQTAAISDSFPFGTSTPLITMSTAGPFFEGESPPSAGSWEIVFSQPWDGFVTWYVVGSAANLAVLGFAGTVNISSPATYIVSPTGTNTTAVRLARIRAQPGEVLNFDFTAAGGATFTRSEVFMAEVGLGM